MGFTVARSAGLFREMTGQGEAWPGSRRRTMGVGSRTGCLKTGRSRDGDGVVQSLWEVDSLRVIREGRGGPVGARF